MRQIKFRAKDENGQWVYGNLVQYKEDDGEEITCIVSNERCNVSAELVFTQVNPETIGQFTGLYDNNGKEVYEGDIVNNKWCFNKNSIIKFGEYQHLSAQREYANGDLGFYLYHIDEFEQNVERNDIIFFFGNDGKKSDIIGNIYDNHELI